MQKQTKSEPLVAPMAKLVLMVAIFVIGGILAWQWQWLKIAKYLHKDAIPHLYGAAPYRGIPSGEIPLKEAILFAIQHLENKGVKNIKICETEWIVAPLGGYLINGKCNFHIGDKTYLTFRIGVRDGSEGNAGEEFVFIARGKDNKGKVIWYPEPGPDFHPTKDEVFPVELLDYEFLGDRERFESLSDRFK